MPIETDKVAILKLLDDVRRAHQDKDAAKIVSKYNKDAVIFDLSPPLLWLDTGEGPVDRASRGIEITVSSDTAFCHGLLELSGVPKKAGREIRLWMRATFCFAREGNGWKIVHEHTSVPFYMDGSFRAALDLKPRIARSQEVCCSLGKGRAECEAAHAGHPHALPYPKEKVMLNNKEPRATVGVKDLEAARLFYEGNSGSCRPLADRSQPPSPTNAAASSCSSTDRPMRARAVPQR